MVKLQKAIRHERRKSLSTKSKVAKLTPAEIRSLNHSVGLSKNGSVRSIDNHSVRRLASTTPPLTPDNHHSPRRQSQSQSQRRSSADLPTPPLSPDRERRGSSSSARHIHAPRPVSQAQAVHLANAAAISRPSSQSSYRGVATYRGNEITRNNSLTMLQHPSQQIVSNPLSQFSRPRQSTMTSSTSPNRSVSEQPPGDNIAGAHNARDRNQSITANDHVFTRDHSPIRPSDSPVSIEHGEAPNKSTQMQHDPRQEVPLVRLTPKMDDSAKQDEQVEPSVKQRLSWRRTLTGSSEPDPEVARLRKEYKRRTLLAPKNGYCLHAIHYEDTKPGQPPQLRDSLRDELPSAQTSIFKEDEAKQAALDTEYGQHPAVRPLSQPGQRSVPDDSDSSSPSSTKKGKEREMDYPDSDTSSLTSSVPSYSRCSCCGRIQKPGGFESELSPVMENENLRTNFSMEVERMSSPRRRSSSLTADAPRRYIPIIPMEVGNETKQARIEPVKEAPVPQPTTQQNTLMGVAVNKPGDIIASGSTPLAIMPRRKVDPRIVRFASLHRTKEDKLEAETPADEPNETQNLAPPPTLQRFGSLYGLRNENQPSQQQPPPSNLGNTYQPQQARQPQRPINGNHPLRESYTAPQTMAPLQTDVPSRTYNDPYSAEDKPLEKPLGDSPVSHQNGVPMSPRSNFSDDDDAAMVDLSSFDGSFVQHSLSRSATTIQHNASPPTTSAGVFASPADQPPKDESAVQEHPPMPPKIDTSIVTSENPMDTTTTTPKPQPGQWPYHVQRDTQPQTQPQPQSQTSTPPSEPTTSSGSSTKSATIYHPASTGTPATTTTIVRILPSTPVPASSGTASPIAGKGPLRLGDWVLPESPTTSSALGSRKGSLQGEQLRGVAAA